jgi:purine-binding chemotaxis protein CheW
MASETTSVKAGVTAPIETGMEFLAFSLGHEEYRIDIQAAQELCGYDIVTRMANGPGFIKGVINLRGIIVPIVDMRPKFGLGAPTR